MRRSSHAGHDARPRPAAPGSAPPSRHAPPPGCRRAAPAAGGDRAQPRENSSPSSTSAPSADADQSQPRRIRRRSRHRRGSRRLRRHHHLGLRPLRRQHRHPDLGRRRLRRSSGSRVRRCRLWGAPGRGRRAAGGTPSAGRCAAPRQLIRARSSTRAGRKPSGVAATGSAPAAAQQRPPGLHARPRRLGLPPRPAAAGSSTEPQDGPGTGNPAHPGPAQDPHDGSGPDGCGGPDGPEGAGGPRRFGERHRRIQRRPRMKPRTRRARLHHRHLPPVPQPTPGPAPNRSTSRTSAHSGDSALGSTHPATRRKRSQAAPAPRARPLRSCTAHETTPSGWTNDTDSDNRPQAGTNPTHQTPHQRDPVARPSLGPAANRTGLLLVQRYRPPPPAQI